MEELRVILVDDEEVTRRTMTVLLSQHFPSVSVVAEAGTVAAAVRAIEENSFDLLFLDVDLPPEGTGLTF